MIPQSANVTGQLATDGVAPRRLRAYGSEVIAWVPAERFNGGAAVINPRNIGRQGPAEERPKGGSPRDARLDHRGRIVPQGGGIFGAKRCWRAENETAKAQSRCGGQCVNMRLGCVFQIQPPMQKFIRLQVGVAEGSAGIRTVIGFREKAGRNAE